MEATQLHNGEVFLEEMLVALYHYYPVIVHSRESGNVFEVAISVQISSSHTYMYNRSIKTVHYTFMLTIVGAVNVDCILYSNFSLRKANNL